MQTARVVEYCRWIQAALLRWAPYLNVCSLEADLLRGRASWRTENLFAARLIELLKLAAWYAPAHVVVLVGAGRTGQEVRSPVSEFVVVMQFYIVNVRDQCTCSYQRR